jgi:hypothetical protein
VANHYRLFIAAPFDQTVRRRRVWNSSTPLNSCAKRHRSFNITLKPQEINAKPKHAAHPNTLAIYKHTEHYMPRIYTIVKTVICCAARQLKHFLHSWRAILYRVWLE